MLRYADSCCSVVQLGHILLANTKVNGGGGGGGGDSSPAVAPAVAPESTPAVPPESTPAVATLAGLTDAGATPAIVGYMGTAATVRELADGAAADYAVEC